MTSFFNVNFSLKCNIQAVKCSYPQCPQLERYSQGAATAMEPEQKHDQHKAPWELTPVITPPQAYRGLNGISPKFTCPEITECDHVWELLKAVQYRLEKQAWGRHARPQEHFRRWIFVSNTIAIVLCPSNIVLGTSFIFAKDRNGGGQTGLMTCGLSPGLPHRLIHRLLWGMAAQWLTHQPECSVPPPAFLSSGNKDPGNLTRCLSAACMPHARCKSLDLPIEHILSPPHPKIKSRPA